MIIKKAFIFICFIAYGSVKVYGQDDEFCNALTTIMHDAPNKFRNIRGNVTDDNANATMWACGIKVPGTINSRFVASMGLFYEGAVFQSKNKGELGAVYEKYKGLLNSCLLPDGYNMSLAPNFTPGLDDYKKIVFMQEPKEDIKPENAPAHITMEALYSKETGYYTVVFFIFEH